MRRKALIRDSAGFVALVFGIVFLGQNVPRPYADESIETSPSKVERKNKAPISRDVLRVKLPRPIGAKLQNGLRVLILEDHRTPAVFVQLHIGGAGALFEPPNMTGLANATAQMLREGTQSRTSVQIAEEIDRLGASLGAAGSFGSSQVVLNASGLSNNFDSWFALAVDVLLNPSFPKDELEKLKQRLRAQLRQQRSAANFLVNERFSHAVYGDHPAAIVSPTSESLDALTQAALMKWHRERYAPQNALLAIAGDVRAEELIPQLEKWFAGWEMIDVKRPRPANPVPATARRVYLVHRPNSVQTTVALGNIAIDRRSPDYIPMVVMNHILGGGVSGRLFLNLREEKGYTYGVYSDFSALRYPGPWRAGGSMRTEVTAGALVEFLKEINRIRDQTVPSAELEDSKRAIAARFALSLEQPTAILGLAVSRIQYRLPEDYWDTYPTKIMAVTAEDVQRVARKYLDPEAMQLVAVGDGVKIHSVLESYGPLEVYDSSGKLTSIPKTVE
jgi:predicted Zn-dependent peptidase